MLFDQPIPFLEALQSRLIKALLPTRKNSEDLAKLAPQLRERAVFSARVANISFLQNLEDTIEEVLQPEGINVPDARLKLLLGVRAIGYQAPPGKEGTIEDLSSRQRLDLIAEMNTNMALGYGKWQQSQDERVLDAYPAFEFVRIEDRIEPRDWPERWESAGGDFFPGQSDYPEGRMIAFKDDPIWTTISQFGLPYPPFDYNSGMGLIDVDREECIKLGLIDEEHEEEVQVEPQDRGFNEDLQASGDFSEPFLRTLRREGYRVEDGVLMANQQGPIARARSWLRERVAELANSFMGHAGRPGQKGGSLPRGAAGAPDSQREENDRALMTVNGAGVEELPKGHLWIDADGKFHHHPGWWHSTFAMTEAQNAAKDKSDLDNPFRLGGGEYDAYNYMEHRGFMRVAHELVGGKHVLYFDPGSYLRSRGGPTRSQVDAMHAAAMTIGAQLVDQSKGNDPVADYSRQEEPELMAAEDRRQHETKKEKAIVTTLEGVRERGAALSAANTFDPSEPRDDTGRWTSGGLSASVAGGLSDRLRQSGGYTYDPIHKKSPTSGFAVSAHKECEEVVENAKDVDEGKLRQYWNRVQAVFKQDPHAHLGGWFNRDNGKVYLDVVNVYPDRETALSEAKRLKEIAIFDLGGQQEIMANERGRIVRFILHPSASFEELLEAIHTMASKHGKSGQEMANAFYGHAGRPGQRGGSLPGGGWSERISSYGVTKELREKYRRVNWEHLANLGETESFHEAGYIAPAGQLLDFSGKNEGGTPGMRAYDHREAGGTEGMMEAMASGFIRMGVSRNDNYASAHIARKPTGMQMDKIHELVKLSEGKLSLDLSDGIGEWDERNERFGTASREWHNEYDGESPDTIKEDIEAFYSGRTPGVGMANVFFGHAGRPGMRGGSLPSGERSAEPANGKEHNAIPEESHPQVKAAQSLMRERFKDDNLRADGTTKRDHCQRVASLVTSPDPDVKMVAYLHDIVEDTDTKPEEVRQLFGDKVADAVANETWDKDKEDYEQYLHRLVGNPISVQSKLADMTDNMDSMKAWLDAGNQPTKKTLEKRQQWQQGFPIVLQAFHEHQRRGTIPADAQPALPKWFEKPEQKA